MEIRKVFGALTMTLVMVGLSGCGIDAQPEARAYTPTSTRKLVSLIRQTVSYDYEPFATPAALLDDAGISVLGRIDHVDGALVDDGVEETGAVIVALSVDETWKDDPARSSDLVYYLIRRPTNLDVSLYRQALSRGTRVTMFGYQGVEELTEGDPGDVFYDPAPQGLIIEISPSETINVWGAEVDTAGWSGVDTISDLRAATVGEGS